MLAPKAILANELYDAARRLFDAWAAEEFSPVRLIGMAGKNLVEGGGQLSLFPDPQVERQRAVDGVVDQINADRRDGLRRTYVLGINDAAQYLSLTRYGVEKLI